jgi:hypothetical protein
LKDFAARSLLLKLEAQEFITLPPLQESKRRPRRGGAALAQGQEPPVWGAVLAQLEPLKIELVKAGTADRHAWAFYLEQYHYLGLRGVGENVGDWVRDNR